LCRGPRIRETLAAFKGNINKKNYIGILYYPIAIIETAGAKIGDFKVEFLRESGAQVGLFDGKSRGRKSRETVPLTKPHDLKIYQSAYCLIRELFLLLTKTTVKFSNQKLTLTLRKRAFSPMFCIKKKKDCKTLLSINAFWKKRFNHSTSLNIKFVDRLLVFRELRKTCSPLLKANFKSSVADSDPGSGIRCFLSLMIRDPG
jgi:hypothetical protein